MFLISIRRIRNEIGFCGKPLIFPSVSASRLSLSFPLKLIGSIGISFYPGLLNLSPRARVSFVSKFSLLSTRRECLIDLSIANIICWEFSIVNNDEKRERENYKLYKYNKNRNEYRFYEGKLEVHYITLRLLYYLL